MALGPFTTYVPPGVYSRTLTEANVAALVAGLRIPTIIGVGQEELEQLDLEMVRGSSSTLDQQIVNEDITVRWIVDDTNPANPILGVNDGTRTRFKIRNFPVVDGQGFGRTTNDVRSVTVTVNGIPVAIGAVRGSTGEVVLQVPPQPTDVVRCTYFFHRGDTAFTDNLSDQVTTKTAEIVTPGYQMWAITAGANDNFRIKVNGGAEVSVTFTAAPAATASSLKTQIDAAAIVGLTTSVFTANDGTLHLQFNAATSVEIGDGNANGIFGLANGQKTARNATFKVFQRPIVDGTSGGLTTTDPSKVVVKVNGIQVIPASVDGTNGTVTLPTAPAPAAEVLITYFANTWQDTFDYLPNTLVTNVIRSGISPGRADFIQNQDFVVSNPSPDVSIIHWGTSYAVSSTLRTPGAELFDDSQVGPTLVDDKLWLVECAAFVDNSVVPARTSTTDFLLPTNPTTGNGRDTVLGLDLFFAATNQRQDLISNRPDLVVVRVGRNLRDALNRPAAKVLSIDGASRKITLKDAVPPDYKAFATFYYNRIADDTYILTCKTPGPIGTGQFEVFSSLFNSNVLQVRFGSKGGGLVDTVQWPRGVEQVPDVFHFGGTPVSETVTVTFGVSAATNAVYTNKGAQPFSFYGPSSATWRTVLNGGGTLVTNLNVATRGYLVSQAKALSGGGFLITAAVNDQLDITIDGVDLSVTLPVGPAVTPAAIATAVNAVIDAHATFLGTAPNNMFTPIPGPGASSTFFVLRSYAVPAALPAGFDHTSYSAIRQGTAESTLGFATFQRADGTTGAINKAATILSTLAQPYSVVGGVSDEFKVRINGIDFTALINPASTTAALVVIDINTAISSQGAASVGTGVNLNKVRITSNTNSDQSAVLILNGSANAVLGFNEGDFASQTRVSIQEVVDRLMDTVNFAVSTWTPVPVPFATGAVAYPSIINAQSYLTIESVVLGTTSAITFVTGANSAFNVLTGTQIVPGTDGDSGEGVYDNFVVTSNNPNGSAGTGIPGQTYTDVRSGLRFSILPGLDGSYNTGGFFTLEVSPTWNVNPSVPYLSIPGLETIVTNTVNVGVNDTATLQTFNPSGVEPKNGDFYFISYRFLKQDFSTRIFRQFKTIQANFGTLSAENRVTLGAFLAILNGAVLVGIKQVLKIPNTNQASAQSFIDAIQGLGTPLPGNIKPDIIIPLATDTAVYSYLTQHCEILSNIRNQSERMGFIGFASGTTPTTVQTIARGLVSQRIVAFYPDSAVITLSNELGETFETLVDGSFFAAAYSGAACSPAIDVATPYTRRRVQGFTRIPRILDAVELNQTATAGVTLLEDLDPIVRVRQGLTTNMSSVLTRLPTVTQIADFVSLNSRAVLDAFVGTKFLSSRVNEVEVSMTSLFKLLIQQEIVAAFTGISAQVDAEDPTILRAEAFYQPIFPLLYLVLTFNLRARI
jgi:hypothetical protein